MKKLFFYLLFISYINVFCQEINDGKIEEKEIAEILNASFLDNQDITFKLYEDYLGFKGWVTFLADFDFFDAMYGNCICKMKKKTLKLEEIFTKEEINKVRDINSSHIGLNKIQETYLNKNFHLFNDSLRRQDVNKITKPIIINEKAIFYRITENEEQIFILKKIQGVWTKVCIKWTYLVLVD